MLTKHEYAQLDYHFRVRNAAGFILGTPYVAPAQKEHPVLPERNTRYHLDGATGKSRCCGVCGHRGHDRRYCPKVQR